MIRNISFEETEIFHEEMRRDKLIILDRETLQLFGYFEGRHLIGFVGVQHLGSTLKYRTDFVAPKHRGKGIYSQLFKYRDDYKNRNFPTNKIVALCTKQSLDYYLKNGFVIKHKYKNEITKVERL